MNKYVSRGLWTVLVTGGFMALGVGVAHADTGTTGEDGIASGTQGILGIELPVQLGGNAISLLGDAHSSGATTSAPATAAPADASGGTSGSDSVAGGTQLLPELGVPITLGGNSISVFGDALSTAAETTPATVPAEGSAASGSTDGTNGVLSGTQVLSALGVPVTLGGNAISVLGNASSDDASTASGSATSDQEGSTSGTDGTLGGTQLLADAGVPVTLSGNAISLLGDASSTGSATAPGASGSTGGDAGSGGTDGTAGTLAGTQLLADIGVPLTLGGNAISVLGTASTDGSTIVPGTDPGTDPGADPGTDPGADPGTDWPTFAFAADGAVLPWTGVDDGIAALGMAAVLLTVGGVLLLRRASTHRR